jgi:hypothetical protein
VDVSDCDGAAADDDGGDGCGGALNVVDSWLDMVCGVWTGECVCWRASDGRFPLFTR